MATPRSQVFSPSGQVKPTLGDVETILDPMLSDNYEFLIPKLPDGVNSIGGIAGNRMLRLYCKSATKPGIENTPVDVDLYGHKLKFSGRTTYDNTMTVEFVENRNGEVIQLLEDWHEMVRSPAYQLGRYKSGKGGGSDGYKAEKAIITIVDQPGITVAVYELYNIFPTTLPEMQFTGEDATVISQSITFSYDWWEAKGKKYSGASSIMSVGT